tara:strand:- start:716 stop:1243 length:528 start_codon:yes stop_codon:yes gene_type:complete
MKNEQVQAIKNIVNSHLEIDVDFKTRKDLYVKARAICYKILRDECLLTYDFIGQQFQKNHATVLHALNEFPFMLKSDSHMDTCYQEILFIWRNDNDEYLNLKPLQLKKQVNDLKTENKTLTQLVKETNSKLEELSNTSDNKWGKYKSIIDLMDQRVPSYKLNRFEKKLKEIINGL